MPAHHDTHYSPYTPRQLFDLVADIEHYPAFLPWVVGAKILSRQEHQLEAVLLISFKLFRERYTSDVRLFPGETPEAEHRIEVTMKEGPFTHLTNSWRFSPISQPDGAKQTEVQFSLDFAFRSALLENVIGGLFAAAVRKMSAAFETRAKQLYG